MPHTTSATLRAAASPVIAAVIVAAIIAGCGGAAPSAQAPTSASATVEASAAPTETAASSAIPEATPAPSVVVPSFTAETPLVDILPAELAGEATQKLALVGDDLTSLDGSTAMVFGSLLNFIDAEAADMTIGAASNARASVIAIRIKGKSATEVGDAMIKGRTLNATTTTDELDLGGKQVIKVTTTIAPLPFYVYGTQDVSFTIVGADEGIVAEALSKLP